MIYAQVANSYEELLRFFMKHDLRALLNANSKIGLPAVRLPPPSAPPSSIVSNIDDSDQDFHTNRKRSSNIQKDPLLSLRAVLVAQGPVDFTRRTRRGVSA
ncbi:MAG: hypothetical protein EZS28_007744 [Streblomastix strix]|uniref:Uncharacterized protein n=1 Tax=Streblomastix strix TaxID=222440 RepID=A0A5J4WP78_9EUKA|nr:MAG: hypothetical protein EZS28_007744 [Streblomastix strix]